MNSISTREFKEIIKFTITSGLKQPILGLGAPGIGKSEIIQQIGKELGYHVEDLRLAQMSEVELCGLIYPNENRTETTWLIPDWFPKEGGPKTILLLDEITSATKRVQVAAYQLVLDRRLGRHFLPEDTVIIALGNGEDDGGVYEELAAPLANRFEIYNVQMDAKAWVEDYARVYRDKNGNGVNPLVTSYIESHPTSLHTQAENEDEIVFASPRTWKRVSDTLNASQGFNKVVLHKICACIGQTLGYEFYKYAESFANEQTASQVLLGQDPAVPEGSAARQYVTESLISIYTSACNSPDFDNEKLASLYNNVSNWVHKLSAEEEAAVVQAISSVKSDVVVLAMSQGNGVDQLAQSIQNVYNDQPKQDIYSGVQTSSIFADSAGTTPQVGDSATPVANDPFAGITVI